MAVGTNTSDVSLSCFYDWKEHTGEKKNYLLIWILSNKAGVGFIHQVCGIHCLKFPRGLG
jgi:hypothetical protein